MVDCEAVPLEACNPVPLDFPVAVPNLSWTDLFPPASVDGFTTASRTVDLAGDVRTTLLVVGVLADLILGRGVGDLGRAVPGGERRLVSERLHASSSDAPVAGRLRAGGGVARSFGGEAPVAELDEEDEDDDVMRFFFFLLVAGFIEILSSSSLWFL